MQPKKKTSPILWLAIAAVGIAAFVMTEPQATAKSSTTRRNNTTKVATTGLITEADMKAKFDRVNNSPKNAFMPVVKKSVALVNSSPNALPAELTGGESGWAYTGTAAVDGRIQAVVENPSTGQGDFLTVGQTWKKARVVAVTEDSLTLQGSDGQQVTVKMQEKLSSNSMMAGGFAPVDVSQGLRGQIGPVTVRPETPGTPPAGTVASEGDNNAN